MTFKFDTYSADILNTPTIIGSNSTSFVDDDAKFFAINLTSCAFYGEKYDSTSPKIDQIQSGTSKYKKQVYYITPTGSSSSYRALAGFTWSEDIMYFSLTVNLLSSYFTKFNL